MIGKTIGFGFATARNIIARGLVRIGVTPNMLSVLGMLLMVCAGVCYALGASHNNAFLPLAGVFIVLSSASDILDGAVARIGGKASDFGAFLDSTLDRFSDFAIYAGIAISFAWQNPANMTYILLAMVAFLSSFMISYTRARAENLIPDCSTGFWQRGERTAAIVIATFAGNIPAMLIQQAWLPMMTALGRVMHTKAVIAGKAKPDRKSWFTKIQIWRARRMTVGYDISCMICVAWLIFVRFDAVDYIRQWLN
ncbi:MAG TPA: CDP-alcohol phosphatidyltransferase family protein [Phycisphaerae bacterium]|nr:CDP-alcohol phosphatidyltransferase family protein [Phycisphaerae bacterium]